MKKLTKTKMNGVLACALILSFIFSCTISTLTEEQKTEARIDSLINLMTFEEKISMTHGNTPFTSSGVERLGIPGFTLSDGPYGVRREIDDTHTPKFLDIDSATYLPKGPCLSATWNTNLGYEFGRVLGSEASYRGKDIILGPGINIIRTPLNGRNFEYLSEDPYLNARMAVGYIKGVQDQGIAACVKHFVANNQETDRLSVNVSMDERTLREIYFPAFKASVIEAEALTVMGAYNKFRGQWCSHNDYLLNQVLKGEWGFKGAVISDWNATHDTRQALLHGLDLEMGTELSMMWDTVDYEKFFLAGPAREMIASGEVDSTVVDDKVRRLLRVMFATQMVGHRPPGEYNTPGHQAVALKIAEEGMVLLQNDGVLPLKTEEIKSIAIIGDNATHKHALGGGSSQITAKYEVTILEGIKKAFAGKAEVTYAQGYVISRDNHIDKTMFQEAIRLAKEADIVIYAGGWIQNWGVSDWSDNVYDSEDTDKPDLKMPFGQEALIQELIKANSNIVVALVGGGPMEISSWSGNARALVQTWYAGMEGGTAFANILTGKVNPSGKLPMTFPKRLDESPAHVFGEHPGENLEVSYNEGIFVGYRYNDTYDVEPHFCFGHGLSYTHFEYSDLSLKKEESELVVRFTLKNTGEIKGAEVAQIYVHDLESLVKRPEKELKGFEKVLLEPGESQSIELKLVEDAFKYYDVKQSAWVLESGEFKISVGSSSADIRLQGSVTL